MKFAGDLTSPKWEEFRRGVDDVGLTEWKRRFQEFMTLDFTNKSFDFVDREWKKRKLFHPIIIQPYERYDKSLWRIRMGWNDLTDNPQLTQSFSYPPSNITALGRANIPKNPAFYCTSSPRAAFLECGQIPDKDVRMTLTSWEFSDCIDEFKMHQFLNFHESSPYFHVAKEHTEMTQENNAAVAGDAADIFNFMSEQFGKAFLDDRYQLTSWIGHKLIYKASHMIDGIMYPSIATNHHAVNITFNPNFVRNLKMTKAYAFQSTRDGTDFSIQLLAFGKAWRNGVKWVYGDEIDKQIEMDFIKSLREF